ncbi:MAG: hypothetical protein K0R17_2818 [Rariglobus sp.]|jgi:hypothetical protein|nr:hypothetical protein [Rariglobus sp.]
MKRLFAFAFLFAAVLQAEPRTFTDQFGRSITAELLSVEGDNVRIRREDGQLFTLSISKLTEADQKFIKDWAAKPAPAEEKSTPDPKKLIVGLSRGKFSSRTLTKYDTYTHKHEDWGFSIQLTNQHLRPVENLRVEYNLFARTYSDISSPTMITGSKVINAIASRGSETFRTRSTEVCKTKDTYFGYNSGGEMRGIWIRIYADDQLLIEQSSPESLMTSDKWTKVGREE